MSLATARYRWVLFDADGTLFDYDRAEKSALAKTFADSGVAFQAGILGRYREINGKLWLAFERGELNIEQVKALRFERLLSAMGYDLEPVAFSRAYLENLAAASFLIDGVEQTIRTLHGRVGLMVITNGLQVVQRSRLAGSSIGNCFSDVVISEEVGVAKPAAGIFDEAFRRMGNPARQDVLLVGDSLTSDIKGGGDYGLDTCWFNPSGRMGDSSLRVCYEIRRPGELVPIIFGDGDD